MVARYTDNLEIVHRKYCKFKSISIETGRHNNIARNERKCCMCNNNDIEDEYHFVLICALYDTVRKQYISIYFVRKSCMYKFLELLNSERTSVLTK